MSDVSEAEEKFNRIVQQALARMANVKCGVDEYKLALRVAIDEFQVALDSAGE